MVAEPCVGDASSIIMRYRKRFAKHRIGGRRRGIETCVLSKDEVRRICAAALDVLVRYAACGARGHGEERPWGGGCGIVWRPRGGARPRRRCESVSTSGRLPPRSSSSTPRRGRSAIGATVAMGRARPRARPMRSRAVAERFPQARARIAVTGSGARDIARALGASYVQEVVANAIAVRALYPQVRCAIELGGQDAKMIFFRTDEGYGRAAGGGHAHERLVRGRHRRLYRRDGKAPSA